VIRPLRTIAVAATLLAPVLAAAQRGAGRANRLNGPPGGMPPEQQIARMLNQRLELSDAQLPKMQETLRHFQARRSALGAEEVQMRRSMRDMICSGDTTRGAEMTKLLDQWYDVGRRRLQMQEEEQRELSAFLTPYQRAKYIGFEEQFSRVIEDRLAGRGGRGGAPGDGQDPRAARQGRAGRQQGGPPPDGVMMPRGGRQGPPPDACGPPPEGPQRMPE